MNCKKYNVLIAIACGVMSTLSVVGLFTDLDGEEIEIKATANMDIVRKAIKGNEDINKLLDESSILEEDIKVLEEKNLTNDYISYVKAEETNINDQPNFSDKNQSNNIENNQVVNENNNIINNGNSNSSDDTTIKPEEDKVEDKEPVKNEQVTEETSNEPKVYKDGTYEGSARGYERGLQVSVQVSGGKITSVVVVEHNDTPMFANEAIELMPQRIIQAQSTVVDTVAGATYTSKGIITAVNKALSNA